MKRPENRSERQRWYKCKPPGVPAGADGTSSGRPFPGGLTGTVPDEMLHAGTAGTGPEPWQWLPLPPAPASVGLDAEAGGLALGHEVAVGFQFPQDAAHLDHFLETAQQGFL